MYNCDDFEINFKKKNMFKTDNLIMTPKQILEQSQKIRCKTLYNDFLKSAIVTIVGTIALSIITLVSAMLIAKFKPALFKKFLESIKPLKDLLAKNPKIAPLVFITGLTATTVIIEGVALLTLCISISILKYCCKKNYNPFKKFTEEKFREQVESLQNDEIIKNITDLSSKQKARIYKMIAKVIEKKRRMGYEKNEKLFEKLENKKAKKIKVPQEKCKILYKICDKILGRPPLYFKYLFSSDGDWKGRFRHTMGIFLTDIDDMNKWNEDYKEKIKNIQRISE